MPSPITRCRELRDLRKLTKVELAGRAGFSLGVIDRLEAATRADDIDCMYVGTFIKVANALSVAPSTLYPALGYYSKKGA